MTRTLQARLALALSLAIGGASLLAREGATRAEASPRVEVTIDPTLQTGPLDGRLLLIVARGNASEPRFQVGRGLASQPLFGVDVDGLRPGAAIVVDAGTRGWPVESLSQIPAGDYWVQAVFNVYTTFQRVDGHTIKAHMDHWEGQHWNRSPGNLYSEPRQVHVDPAAGQPIRIALTRMIPPISPPADTKYVKHIRFKSPILSRWWGHDIDLGAIVVLPEGFDQHPDARYPVAYSQGHFPTTFNVGEPGAPASGRGSAGASRFFDEWTSGRLGRFLIVLMQHPTPFYDDSYAVNSANNGPYGDALTQELIPRVERQFRGIGQPWARVVYGGSTGGWESLAWQVFYPDLFNGTWTFCPDPVDFRHFQLVNIYEDRNAFYPNSEWKSEPIRPWQRMIDDQAVMSQKDASHLEEVLGTRGRSGDQMDIFMATYGPAGSDGYPKLLYDKWTGAIDRSVAEYWREHYDLRHILQRDWKTLGPKLVGKLHLYVGDMDTYFLEEAGFQLQEFLESTKDPYYAGSFDIGKRQPHCYAGMPAYPGQRAESRVLPEMLERILKTAPPGADMRWKY
jgi:enterochelin esterase-like enzyme